METSNPLDRWLKLKKTNPANQAIVARPSGGPSFLSFGQERLWFLSRLFPESPAYHFSDTLRLKGKLDVNRLKKSIEGLILRHEVLRSTYSFENNQVFQQVSPEPHFEFQFVSLDEFGPEDRVNEAKQFATQFARKPFDLENGPLLRAAVFQLDDEDHIFLITFHHILIDAWSLPVFWKELSTLYRGGTLPELPIQFTDYANWQKKQNLDNKSLDYWKTQLKDLNPVQLPSDFARPAVPMFEGKLVSMKFPETLMSDLQKLAQKAETTLFVLLTAAFKVFLSKYSGETDIAIGTPFAARDRKELDHLIGFFVNSLVLRSDLSGNPGFLDLVKTLKKTTLDAFANSNVPFEKLVDVLKPQRSLNQNPLFNTMLIYRQFSEHPLDLPGISVETILLDTGVSKFDLSLFVDENDKDLTATFEYNSRIFSASTIQRMLSGFHTLIENIIAQPEKPVASLSVLTLPEREEILYKWNSDSSRKPEVKCIHHWIENQALKVPDNIAVSAGKQSITYSGLNDKASKLAAYLQKEGVGPNIPVGLCTDRSIDMIIGLLAILKAGGAYVPIDPNYPQDRKFFMLQDSRVPVLITQLHLAGVLPDTKAKVIFTDGRIPSQEGFQSPAFKEDDLAYIIYTSGSSGQPKGVPVSHKNLVYSTFARFEYYPETPDCFLLLSSFAFDSSLVGIFWTLCSGGTLLLPEQRIEQDMNMLSGLIADQNVSHTLMLPSLYELLLEQAQPGNLKSLSTVIVAGEACSSGLVKLHNLLLPKVALYNEYGPTEATIWSTVHKTTVEDIHRPVPIGRPVPHTQNYILDHNLQPVPIGVPGELYIGGAGVTGNYYKRPELTEDKFIPDPFSKETGAILYKTGDLAFYYPDGLIGFIGRADAQVKIRGFRIELEEIREVIKENSAVVDSVVIVQKGGLKKDSGNDDATKLEAVLNKLAPEEADRLLQFIESLPKSELDYMLSQIEKSETTPSI